jgi:hypothetical protein
VQGFTHLEYLFWTKSDLTGPGGPRCTNNVIQVLVACNGRHRADLYNFVGKHPTCLRTSLHTPANRNFFKVQQEILQPTEKVVELYCFLLRCFTKLGGVVGMNGGAFTVAVACSLLGIDCVTVDKTERQFNGGVARFRATTTNYMANPDSALSVWKNLFRWLQAGDVPARRTALARAGSTGTATPARRPSTTPFSPPVRLPFLFLAPSHLHFLCAQAAATPADSADPPTPRTDEVANVIID